MANEEHLARLKQGVDVWNRWRDAHPEIEPDLSGVELAAESLRMANLLEANLSGASLTGVDLSKAILLAANLGTMQSSVR